VAGGSGSSSTSTTPNSTDAGILAGCPGGGGSGANTLIVRQAANGAPKFDVNLNTILAGGAGGIESGTIDGQQGSSISSAPVGYPFLGTGGGGGGGQSTGIVAGNGANAILGGGAGGGGGSINATTSGSGGNGFRGEIRIYEWF